MPRVVEHDHTIDASPREPRKAYSSTDWSFLAYREAGTYSPAIRLDFSSGSVRQRPLSLSSTRPPGYHTNGAGTENNEC